MVRVSAAPVAQLDLLCASGSSYFGVQPLPYVPGTQGVGTIVNSSAWAVGTRVWFATSAGMEPGNGTWAEQARPWDDDVVVLDSVSLDDMMVAAIGQSGVAGWMAVQRARVTPGEVVVILGATGVVGRLAVLAAKSAGARVVALCRRTPDPHLAGADVTISYGRVPLEVLANLVREASGGAVNVVIDPVFGPLAEALLSCLERGGRWVNLGGASADEARFSSSVIRSRALEVLGYTNAMLTAAERGVALLAALRLAQDQQLVIQHDEFGLEDIATAWNRAKDGSVPGRTVLRIC